VERYEQVLFEYLIEYKRKYLATREHELRMFALKDVDAREILHLCVGFIVCEHQNRADVKFATYFSISR
jgi:hypothetical protein